MGADAEQIKLIFAVVAAGYVLFEYQSSLRETAVKQTMEFQTRYAEDEVSKAHLDLDSMLLNFDTQKLLLAAPSPSETITELVIKNKFEGHVIILADFFGQLATCVQSGVCDLETACAVFKSRVAAHWNNYHNLFQRWGPWGQILMKPTFEFFDKRCK
jgi:hypothetical protein